MKKLIREYTFEAELFDAFFSDLAVAIKVNEDGECSPVDHIAVTQTACNLFAQKIIKDIERRTAELPTYGVVTRWREEEAASAQDAAEEEGDFRCHESSDSELDRRAA